MQAIIKAFSVIETIVAMILLTITFGIAISTFDLVTNTDNVAIKTNAQLSLKAVIAKTKRDKTFYDETIELNGFFIKKIVQPYEKIDNQNLIHLQVTASLVEEGTPILIINSLIVNKNE